MSRKTLLIILTLIALAVLSLLCVYRVSQSKKDTLPKDALSKNEVAVPLETIDLASLIQKSALKQDTLPFQSSRPIPTNQWYSSLFFQKNGLPLYSFPWAVRFTDDGFQAGSPTVVASPSIVTGGMAPDITFTGEGKHDGVRVDTWDDLSILASAKSGDAPMFSLRIVRGSPFLWGTLAMGQKYTLRIQGEIRVSEVSGRFLIQGGEKTLAIYLDPGEVQSVLVSPQELSLTPTVNSARFALAVLPTGDDINRYADFAADPVIETKVTYDITESTHAVQYTLQTASGRPTLFGLLPHHLTGTLAKEHADFGQLTTIRGMQRIREGQVFAFSYPDQTGSYRFDFEQLTSEEKNMLRQTISADVAKLAFPDPDTYFSGKRLLAAAHLVSLASELGEEASAREAAEKLRDQFALWRDGTVTNRSAGPHFVYDPLVRGVVGYQPSFGSELFNDHHFHYGYFILAAAILGEYDPAFVEEYAPFINLLVSDVATLDRESSDYAYLRSYDHYEGHSWAAGQALFEDGNNEESTSEAIQAWYGIAKWSGLIGATSLEQTARTLYYEESRSALAYWLKPSWSGPSFTNFTAPLVSLVWGGKAEYATWFSPTAEAKLGIELLPLGAQSGYLLQESEALRKNLGSVSLAPGALFRDAHLMALAMVDRAQARTILPTIDDASIDTWNTRSYLMAWVLAGKFDEQKDAFEK